MEYSGILSQDFFAFLIINSIKIEVMPPEIIPPIPIIFINESDFNVNKIR